MNSISANSITSHSSALDALPPYVFAELDRLKAAARARGMQFVDLGIGSPDGAAPAAVVEALADAVRDPRAHGYPPFRGVPSFLESVSRFMRDRFGTVVDPTREVLAVSGAKEGLAHVAFAHLGHGDVALVPDIYYPVHGRAPLLAGATLHLLPMRADHGFLPCLEEVPASVLRRAKLLVVSYPNNPTGAVAPREFYEGAVAFCRRHGILLVSDLAYSELTFDGYVAPSVLEVNGARDVAIEFHSLSKTFNMAGFRLGFAVGGAAAIDMLAAYRSNVGYGTPSSVQSAGAVALDRHRELSAAVREEYRVRRDAVVVGLRSHGWDIEAPLATMYAWLLVPQGFGDWEWTRYLLDHAGVVVTPGSAFGPGGAGYFRISLVAGADILRDAVDRIAAAARRAPRRVAGVPTPV